MMNTQRNNAKAQSSRPRRWRTLDSGLQRAIRDMMRDDPPEKKATVIRRRLVDEHGEEKVPSLRRIQDYVRQNRERIEVERGEPWSLRNADPSSVRAVLDVLAKAAEIGRVRLTQQEADLAVRIIAAAPDLEPKRVWDFVRDYDWREWRGEDTADLDLALALRPWRNTKSRETYEAAFRKTAKYQERVAQRQVAEGLGIKIIPRRRRSKRQAQKEEKDGKRTHPKAGKQQVGVRGARQRRKRQE